MTDREVMQMALTVLEQITPDWRTSIDKHEQLNNSIEALRTALAQPEPDARKLAKIHQAAWNAVHKDYKDDPKCCFALGFDAGCDAVAQKVEPSEMKSGEWFESIPASPNKEWVGLTEKDIVGCFDLMPPKFARAVEAKLKEKNT